MGQYWMFFNLDKREYLDPAEIVGVRKLWECIANAGVGAALIVLVAAQPEYRGGGDLNVDLAKDVIGRWAGDRIAAVGDYAKDSDLPAEWEAGSLYLRSADEWTDITLLVLPVLEREIGLSP